ncbi:ABC transporter permease [Candidatus Sororendozoicomonas aggregata]|uniref:ABC transporter permease n=1 Tax=Candidatus Sororendozoicomonas aggregata TaxID=3073239 RepID=UPI002ED3FDC2
MNDAPLSPMGLWQRFRQSDIGYSFTRDKVAIVSAVVFVVFALGALLAPVIAPTNPYDISTIDIMDSELPPVWMEGGDSRFLLGTDAQGRDLFSTILYGMRLSLTIGVLAVLLQALLGISLGLAAGYFGGRLDSFLMRLADIQLSFSTMMVAIIVLAVFKAAFGSELYSQLAMLMLILVIGIAEWPQYARTVRASVLAEKRKEYVEAAQVMGFGAGRIMFRHILPNSLSPVLVISTVQIANAIISEAALSFLGLGMPVTQPSLGALIASGFEYIFSGSWWITVIPGIVLVVLVLVLNLLGDWLRDCLNPKLYKG